MTRTRIPLRSERLFEALAQDVRQTGPGLGELDFGRCERLRLVVWADRVEVDRGTALLFPLARREGLLAGGFLRGKAVRDGLGDLKGLAGPVFRGALGPFLR